MRVSKLDPDAPARPGRLHLYLGVHCGRDGLKQLEQFVFFQQQFVLVEQLFFIEQFLIFEQQFIVLEQFVLQL
jgi:hypothetical protein